MWSKHLSLTATLFTSDSDVTKIWLFWDACLLDHAFDFSSMRFILTVHSFWEGRKNRFSIPDKSAWDQGSYIERSTLLSRPFLWYGISCSIWHDPKRSLELTFANNAPSLFQSIGSAVALEMSLRGYGRKLILLSPFLSMKRVAAAVFPFIKPGVPIMVAFCFYHFRQ